MHLFNQGNEAVRRSLITFYIKFYLVALLSLLTIERVISSPVALFVLCGGTLVPQIVENAINKCRHTPRMSFSIFLMLTQSYFAIYIKGCPSNVLELKSDIVWTLYFIAFVGGQFLMLFLQKKCGSRFFIPKICRSRNEYKYYAEDLEEGNNPDGALTCCICLNPLSYIEDPEPPVQQQVRSPFRMFRLREQNNSRKYMQTPCGHKYHQSCLKAWMRRKLECPF